MKDLIAAACALAYTTICVAVKISVTPLNCMSTPIEPQVSAYIPLYVLGGTCIVLYYPPSTPKANFEQKCAEKSLENGHPLTVVTERLARIIGTAWPALPVWAGVYATQDPSTAMYDDWRWQAADGAEVPINATFMQSILVPVSMATAEKELAFGGASGTDYPRWSDVAITYNPPYLLCMFRSSTLKFRRYRGVAGASGQFGGVTFPTDQLACARRCAEHPICRSYTWNTVAGTCQLQAYTIEDTYEMRTEACENCELHSLLNPY